MSRIYDKPIEIQIIDELTEDYTTLYNVHAKINKAKDDNEYLNAGAIRANRTLTFEVRYFKALEEIALNTQLYRIVYQGTNYNIVAYDDFNENHKTVKMLGVSY